MNDKSEWLYDRVTEKMIVFGNFTPADADAIIEDLEYWDEDRESDNNE